VFLVRFASGSLTAFVATRHARGDRAFTFNADSRGRKNKVRPRFGPRLQRGDEDGLLTGVAPD
jgi:hypothetical protein